MAGARAVRIKGAGGTEVLHIEDFEPPVAGKGELLVEVAAAGLNRADCLQRRGFYPAPPGTVADIPGLEYAGTVVALGDGVSGARVGDRVMGIVAGGAMATHIAVHERLVVPVPDGMELSAAAAIPEVFLTAYDALVDRGALRMGETVLIHAVGSGVGTAALQLARAAGARVVGTSRTAAKLDRCAELGLEHGVVVTDASFADAVRERSGGRGADVVIDLVGAAYLKENVAALATLGRVVVVGLLGGARGELPLGALLAKRGTIVGTVLRSRPFEEKATLTQRFAADVAWSFATGALRPVVDDVMPMSEIRAAHERLESNDTFGKLVLAW